MRGWGKGREGSAVESRGEEEGGGVVDRGRPRFAYME